MKSNLTLGLPLMKYKSIAKRVATRIFIADTDRQERGDAHESPRLRCLVDVQRTKRDDCPQYEEHPTYKKDRWENQEPTNIVANITEKVTLTSN